MSPVNSRESSGDEFSDLGRQLTRKEIRAREKFLATENNDVVPPQAFVTGHEPVQPPEQAEPEEHPGVHPQVPPVAPSVHETAAQQTPVPDMPEAATTVEHPAAHSTQHEDQQHEDHAMHHLPADPEPLSEDAAHGGSAETHGASEYAPPAHDVHDAHAIDDHAVHDHAFHDYDAYPEAHAHDAPGHAYADHHEDEAHHLYDDADVFHDDHHADDPGHPLAAEEVTAAVSPAKSKKVRRRRRLLALLLTLAVFTTALVVGAQFLKPLLGGDKVADYPGPGSGQVNVSVEPGEGTRSVATKLADQKVIANADTFLRELTAAGGTLAPGQFQFRQEMKNSDAVAILIGKEQGKVMYFALKAGLRVGESLQAISDGSGIPVADLKALSDAPAQFGLPAKAKNLEGFLAPGEHRFPLGTSAKDILQNLVGSTEDELKAQGVTDPAKQYDVITVASIVQAEGGQADYGDVAGAIYNRLKPNNTETAGLIQSDATVTYGLGIKSLQLDETQKADKSNPYNTYANPGLPVGPIGSPGKTAIDAAAKPKSNDYLYWVTINLDTKETKFSKTLAEHLGYVDQYNAWCAAHANRCT
ncbi:endolytic transglycosylase MltG [Arthrobacter sp. 92]|uniref:endolytic transglycosylase MltG n=1 Tax=Arthrobacter sp. 92 TaxID=3418175 RepID=UPI0006A867AE|nr:UPF0755 protein YrrL [Arthrobacter sp. Hiyo6]